MSYIKQITYFENKISIDIAHQKTKKILDKVAKKYHYPINYKIGAIKKISTKAVILYTPYKPLKGKRRLLISWDVIKPNSKRVLFSKRLFGYTHTNKFYPGLMQKYNTEKLGKGCISVPVSASQEFLNLFKEMSISIETKEVLDYSKA